MAEQTDVERLKEAKAKVVADLAAAVRLEDQRENLLPKLEKRRSILENRVLPLNLALRDLNDAIDMIEHGVPTDYQLRKPRAPRPEKGAA